MVFATRGRFFAGSQGLCAVLRVEMLGPEPLAIPVFQRISQDFHRLRAHVREPPAGQVHLPGNRPDALHQLAIALFAAAVCPGRHSPIWHSGLRGASRCDYAGRVVWGGLEPAREPASGWSVRPVRACASAHGPPPRLLAPPPQQTLRAIIPAWARNASPWDSN